MMTISIDKVVKRRIRRSLRNSARNLSRAQSSASNLTATGTVAFASKTIRKEVNVKASRIKKLARVTRGKSTRPGAYISIKGDHIPMMDMGARQTKRGMTAKPYKNKPRQLFKGGFIATMPNSARSAFKRVGISRLPIKKIWGPSMITLWLKRETAINRYALNRMKRELANKIQFFRNK